MTVRFAPPNNPLHTALDPWVNTAVLASAGTGKTWLLISRIVRLLLEGVSPGNILAITFTRKAAEEMYARLEQRLFSFLEADDAQLTVLLEQVGANTDTETMTRARNLFEHMTHQDQKVRITTFHAFCQDTLRRFPHEAEIPPGFEIAENTGLLQHQAIDALLSEAGKLESGPLREAMEILMTHCKSIDAISSLLDRFLAHRSDWWAFTAGSDNPTVYASDNLSRLLRLEGDPAALRDAFFSPRLSAGLQEFHALLMQHPIKTNMLHAEQIEISLDARHPVEERLAALRRAMLTDAGSPRSRKESAALTKSLGEGGVGRFLDIHQSVCEALIELDDQMKRHEMYRISSAWFVAGAHLLERFQLSKKQRRLLDFDDLETRTCALLQHGEHARWIQHKLDDRISHLLIDEFQDTNPTQWRMLLPILEELAASVPSDHRSVFIVGDSKQSIYRFRRANPALLLSARDWMSARLSAQTLTLAYSRRSSPAIIEFVNRVFTGDGNAETIAEFVSHHTYHEDLPGKVEVLPLVESQPSDAPTDDGLRNPLSRPRSVGRDRPHYLDGLRVAARIQAHIDEGTLVDTRDLKRPASYEDILILIRNRTHLSEYESALRDSGIPYYSGGGNNLLDYLEIQDLISLLQTLVSPLDSLALAGVLRSPIYGCSDADLIILSRAARESGRRKRWFDTLAQVVAAGAGSPGLAKAAVTLARWHALVGRLPIHDLLDRIYCEADIYSCYRQTFPGHLHHRIQANFTRFIELALEIDSGRYPSLSQFLDKLARLARYDDKIIEEPVASHSQGAVTLMTVHAAKGLEAPIVFVVDSATTPRHRTGDHALVRWPADADRPSSFCLAPARTRADRITAGMIEASVLETEREEANLLYVALTRARQYLHISGCRPRATATLGWYGIIMKNLGESERDAYLTESPAVSVTPVSAASERPAPPEAGEDLGPPLLRRLEGTVPDIEGIADDEHPDDPAGPSAGDTQRTTAAGATDRDALARGIFIHRLLQLSTQAGGAPTEAAILACVHDCGLTPDHPHLGQWVEEVRRVVTAPSLAPYFHPELFDRAYDEVPLSYRLGPSQRHGRIDRLVLAGRRLYLIDYKTRRDARPDNLALLAVTYRDQLRRYRDGLRLLWPEKTLTSVIIFTRCAAAWTGD